MAPRIVDIIVTVVVAALLTWTPGGRRGRKLHPRAYQLIVSGLGIAVVLQILSLLLA